MTDNDLNELLTLIDSASDAPPGARARVWDRVRNDLTDLTADTPGSFEPAQDVEAPTVIDLTHHERVERRSRRWLLGAVAAVVAFVAIGGVLTSQRGQERGNLETDGPAEQPAGFLPILTDPTLACDRYITTSGPLLDLEEAILDGQTRTSDLATAITALDQLIVDFESSDNVDMATLTDLEQIRGGLQQANAHLDVDDPSSATAAFDFVEGVYRNSPLHDNECLG